jgi:hypothetical protein
VTFSIKLQENIYNLMRHCGYSFEREQKEELVFCRILGAGKSGYPRFHVYTKTDKISRETQINLHLDQKKPIYAGAPAHSAEYEGEIIEKEAERIKKIAGQ